MRIKNNNLPWRYQLPLALVGGSQGTEGGSNQSQITESKIYRQTPIILYNVNMAQQDSKKSKVQLP